MTAPDETLFVLTGCTAVGKTDLALEWAESNEAEIVSCDSLLFYRGMDIGTAKPTREERDRVRHHLIDIRDPSEQMDVADFLALAIEAVADIKSRGKKALVTGGSGFYLKAFYEPVVDTVRVSEKTRQKVKEIEESGGLGAMEAALRSLDPECEVEIDLQNPRRVIRALERCIETGKTVRQLKVEFSEQSNALTCSPKKTLLLERDPQELADRIAKRVDQMLRQGLIEEAKRLRAAGLESNPSAAGAIGYRETLSHLRGEYDLEELASRIVTNTRRLAKKQRTWFRTQLPAGETINLSEQPAVDLNQLFR